MTVDVNDLPSLAPVPVAPLRIIEIRPSKGLLDLELRELWAHRDLLVVLVGRDLKIVYRQAAFGIAWAIIQPVFAVAIFSLVFGYFARMPTDGVPYPLFAYAAVLPWTYFAEATRRSASSLVADSELVRKVYFPRLVVVMAGVLAPMVDFALGFVVLLALMIWYGAVPGWHIALVPVLLVIAGALAFAVGLWLGPINVRYRDIKHTLPFIIQIWMYATPIVYPLSIVPDRWRWAYSLNPMVGVIEGFRWAVLGRGEPDVAAMVISALMITVLIVGGLIYFKNKERHFADLI